METILLLPLPYFTLPYLTFTSYDTLEGGQIGKPIQSFALGFGGSCSDLYLSEERNNKK